MAEDCSVLAAEMGLTREMWGQDSFLLGLQALSEPEMPSFQELEVTGNIL